MTVVSDKGEASALINFKTSINTLPPLKLGQNIDLTASPSTQELITYDLNEDGKINAADNAIILSNFGNLPAGRPKNKKADLNRDGTVDQADLDLMAKQVNKN